MTCCLDDNNKGMRLKGKYKITKIVKTTKAQSFKDIKVGDTLKVDFVVKDVGYHSYSPMCEIRINEQKPINDTLKKLAHWLNSYCEFEEVL